MFQSCEEKLSRKKLGLFGSYGWGDGEWMRNWEDTAEEMVLTNSVRALFATRRPTVTGRPPARLWGKRWRNASFPPVGSMPVGTGHGPRPFAFGV